MAKGPFVSGAAVRRQAKHWIGELRIKTPGPQALLRQLSGGNQQKVVFSRALASGADILLLNPVMQLIELLRQSLSRGYVAPTYDSLYIVAFCVVSLCLGGLLERYARKRAEQ